MPSSALPIPRIRALLSPCAVVMMAAISTCACGMTVESVSTTPAQDASAPVVVLELFTSEGCSSCPPADRLLTELASANRPGDRGGQSPDAERSTRQGAADHNPPRVIALSFHVDYWDRLGWPDRFASPDATSRQREYVSALAKTNADAHGGAYTPQLVVNGASGFVGSDRERAAKAIRQESLVPAKVRLTLSASDDASRSAPASGAEVFSVKLHPLPPDAELPRDLSVMLAIVEDGLKSDVKRGENAGATLSHDRVVRAFRVVQPDASGVARAELKLPPDVDRSRSRLVAVAQHAGAGPRRIVGAEEFSLGRLPDAAERPASGARPSRP